MPHHSFCPKIPNLPTESHQMLTTSIDQLPAWTLQISPTSSKGFAPVGWKVGNFGNFSVFLLGNLKISASQREIWHGGPFRHDKFHANPWIVLPHRGDKPQNCLLSNFNTGGCQSGKNYVHCPHLKWYTTILYCTLSIRFKICVASQEREGVYSTNQINQSIEAQIIIIIIIIIITFRTETETIFEMLHTSALYRMFFKATMIMTSSIQTLIL